METEQNAERIAPMTDREQKLFALVKEHGSLSVAGISECRTALALIDRGLVALTSGSLSPDGGSGTLQLFDGDE